MVTLKPEETGLKKLLDRVLNKGVAVDAKATVNLVNTRAQAILYSFKTSAEAIFCFLKKSILTHGMAKSIINVNLSFPRSIMRREHLKEYEGLLVRIEP